MPDFAAATIEPPERKPSQQVVDRMKAAFQRQYVGFPPLRPINECRIAAVLIDETAAAHYELWDTVSGNLLTTFATVRDLGAWLRDYAASNGAGAITALGLLHVDANGSPALIANGLSLVRHLAYAAPPATETPA